MATAQDFLQIIVFSIAALIAISIILPWFLIGLVIIVVAFFSLQHVYLLSSRELKRLEVITRSPVYSHIVEVCRNIHHFQARANLVLEHLSCLYRSYEERTLDR